MKKIAIAAASVAGVVTMGVGVLYAAPKTDRVNPMSNLVTAISEKFHLNSNEVQQVFDAQHAQMQQEMQAKHLEQQKAMLDQAVKDGKLTQDQEDKIIAKRTELKTAMEALKDKTPAERQAAMKTQIDALKQWAKDNNIPEQFTTPFGGGRGMGEKRGGGMMGGRPGMRSFEGAVGSVR